MNQMLPRTWIAQADDQGFREAVLHGLSLPEKAIPAKYLYDARGAELFDAICEEPEYYPTRTETAILNQHAGEIATLAGPHCLLIEFGSGASTKTQILLDTLQSVALYLPVDISQDYLSSSCARLNALYPNLAVLPVLGDFMTGIDLPTVIAGDACRRLGFFPGSTIGNLQPEEARQFLIRTARLLGHHGALLIGVDTKKDKATLDAAYNDAAGVTARFSLNLLARMNDELAGNFEPANFVHDARYNQVAGRIEIHLVSLRNQVIHVADHRFHFAEGERIHTEYSYKYEPAEFSAMARDCGFRLVKVWTDPRAMFSVHYLTVN